jgi:hypothetical protein
VILPSKHLSETRALLSVGALVLSRLRGEATVSQLWDKVRPRRREGALGLTFDWFVLALDLLFAVGAIELHEDRVRRVPR